MASSMLWDDFQNTLDSRNDTSRAPYKSPKRRDRSKKEEKIALNETNTASGSEFNNTEIKSYRKSLKTHVFELSNNVSQYNDEISNLIVVTETLKTKIEDLQFTLKELMNICIDKQRVNRSSETRADNKKEMDELQITIKNNLQRYGEVLDVSLKTQLKDFEIRQNDKNLEISNDIKILANEIKQFKREFSISTSKTQNKHVDNDIEQLRNKYEKLLYEQDNEIEILLDIIKNNRNMNVETLNNMKLLNSERTNLNIDSQPASSSSDSNSQENKEKKQCIDKVKQIQQNMTDLYENINNSTGSKGYVCVREMTLRNMWALRDIHTNDKDVIDEKAHGVLIAQNILKFLDEKYKK